MNQTPARPPPQPAPATQQRFLAEFFDAFNRRTFLLVIGVLLIQVGFVLSYVGAFHHPTPHRVPDRRRRPRADLGPPRQRTQRASTASRYYATAVADQTIGRTLLRHGSTSGLLIVNPRPRPTRCSSPGAAAQRQRPPCRTSSPRPKPPSTAARRSPTPSPPSRETPEDCRASTWSSAGWSAATSSPPCSASPHGHDRPLPAGRSSASSCSSPTPSSPDSAEPSSSAPSSVRSPATSSPSQRSEPSSSTAPPPSRWRFQVLLGTLGVGLTLILFVVLGNPSAGGAYPPPLLPGFWRAISPALPNGAGVQALRHIVYFGSYGITGNLIIIALYIVTAITVAITGTSLLARRAAAGKPAAAVL